MRGRGKVYLYCQKKKHVLRRKMDRTGRMREMNREASGRGKPWDRREKAWKNLAYRSVPSSIKRESFPWWDKVGSKPSRRGDLEASACVDTIVTP